MAKNRKNRINVVFSTDNNFEYNYEDNTEQNTLPVSQQLLYVELDKKKRAGKTVTLITGFVGKSTDLEEIGKLLKNKCGVGGSAKNGEIIVQGDFKEKIFTILSGLGYQVKKRGG